MLVLSNYVVINMLTQKRIFGDLGEKIAKEYLQKHDYKIIDQNYSKRWGEIDIIAESNEKELVFIEIKTRETSGKSSVFFPEDSVNFSKQQKIIKTAQTFLYENKCDDNIFWRIDIIAIEINKNLHTAKIRHLKNAIEI